MATYIALLRGINVGGHTQVSMADLRALFERLGFEEPRSVLQSGNLVFNCRPRPTQALERLLETETEKRLGLRTPFFVRTAKEWGEVISGNPFPKEAGTDPGHLHVMLLKDAPGAGQVHVLTSAITGRETMHVVRNRAYIIYPDGAGRSRLTNALIESKLGTRGTARNWNTVLKISGLTE